MSSINAAVDGVIVTADSTTALDLSTGGTVRMKIDSSGNVGIGTSSPAGRLHARFDAGVSDSYTGKYIFQTTDQRLTIGTYWQSGVGQYATIQSESASSVAQNLLLNPSGGNVGIGTASPSTGVHLNRASGNTYYRAQNGTANADFGVDSAGTGILWNNTNYPLAFGTNNTERMRITSGGEVYIAGTADQGAYNLQCNGTGVWGAGAYVNGSDARIKEDVNPIASGLDVIGKLNPVTYRYKESWTKDQSIQTGFIAQELLTALDGQVYVDGIVQKGGAEGYYSVAYQNIIPILTKAIQEQQAMIDELKAKVAALETK